MRKAFKYNALLLGVALILVLAVPLAMSAPQAATVNAGTPESWTPSSTPGSVSTQGGEVTEVNLSTYTVTSKWVGFWGNISGGIRLADASGNTFYEWTVSDPTGAFVYATNATVSSWDGLAKINGATDPILPDFLIQGTDAYNFTFQNYKDITTPGGVALTGVNYTTTWQGGSQGTNFETYALKLNSTPTTYDILVWAAKASPGTSFNNKYVHYQLLAGVDEVGTPVTFYFYLELP